MIQTSKDFQIQRPSGHTEFSISLSLTHSLQNWKRRFGNPIGTIRETVQWRLRDVVCKAASIEFTKMTNGCGCGSVAVDSSSTTVGSERNGRPSKDESKTSLKTATTTSLKRSLKTSLDASLNEPSDAPLETSLNTPFKTSSTAPSKTTLYKSLRKRRFMCRDVVGQLYLRQKFYAPFDVSSCESKDNLIRSFLGLFFVVLWAGGVATVAAQEDVQSTASSLNGKFTNFFHRLPHL